MDRIALSQRTENLSTVFVDGHPMKRDLVAMSLVLKEMSDEKFASILSKDFEADPKDAAMSLLPPQETYKPGVTPRSPGTVRDDDLSGPSKPPTEQQQRKTEHALAEAISDMASDPKYKGILQKIKNVIRADPDVPQATKTKALGEMKGKTAPVSTPSEEPIALPKLAEDETPNDGAYWNREASAAIMNNLVRDVTGMDKSICCDTNQHLTPNETPDGKHTGVPEKPKTLKPEQTPDQVDVLDSGIVAKSNKTPLKKEAADEDAPAADAPAADAAPAEAAPAAPAAEEAPAADAAPVVEEAAPAAEEPKVEEAKEEETPKENEDKEASNSTTFEAEGVELVSPMEEVTLDDAEAQKLSKLFS